MGVPGNRTKCEPPAGLAPTELFAVDAFCAEFGGVRVTRTESKGRGNKRIRIEVVDDLPGQG